MHRKPVCYLLWSVLAGVLLFLLPSAPYSGNGTPWGFKPILAHFLLVPERAAALRQELGISTTQLESILKIAHQEAGQIGRLENESLAVLDNPSLSQEAKKQWVASSKYNARLHKLLAENQQILAGQLGMQTYTRLVDWLRVQWALERQQFAVQPGVRKGLGKISENTALVYPRSFEVYATRYDAGDRKIVALPDKCLKFANGGALRCAGYDYGQAYSVAISYKGNMVVALVGEAGPWNVDDNYWSKTSDPQPRRMFADLPVGVPEAQAAYFNNYNGGLDQFGRVVTSPVAIDISKALAAELGLGPGNNQVTVSFLWTEGWDRTQDQQDSQPVEVAPPAAPVAWQTATPNPDGSILHTVLSGQTLVGIATIYQIPLDELLAQNNLTMQSIIQPGDQILVQPADPTVTPTHQPKPTLTPTLGPTQTTPPSSTSTPSPAPAEPQSAKTDPFLIGLLLAGLASLALFAWGVFLRNK